MQEECVACASLDFRAIKWEEIQVELLLRDSGGGEAEQPGGESWVIFVWNVSLC